MKTEYRVWVETGERMSEARRQAFQRLLEQAAEALEQCADCGMVIEGAHGACQGVPGGFGEEDV